MRRIVLTGLVFVIALGAYCGTWLYISEQSKAAITTWIAAMPKDRFTISQDNMRRGGFPFRRRKKYVNRVIRQPFRMILLTLLGSAIKLGHLGKPRLNRVRFENHRVNEASEVHRISRRRLVV